MPVLAYHLRLERCRPEHRACAIMTLELILRPMVWLDYSFWHRTLFDTRFDPITAVLETSSNVDLFIGQIRPKARQEDVRRM
jgi:hypothetical protein